MAIWNRNKVPPANLNAGQQYTAEDWTSEQTFNAANNNAFYAVDYAEALGDTPDTSQVGNIGTPTVTLIDNVKTIDGVSKTFKKFKFANLKGEKGDAGINDALVVQELGTSTEDAISQKVITDKFDYLETQLAEIVKSIQTPRIIKKVDFTDGLDEWLYTTTMGITSSELTLQSDLIDYTNVALLDIIKNPRMFSITLSATGNPAQMRMALGTDINNFAFMTISNTSKLISLYTVEGGKNIAKIGEQAFTGTVTLADNVVVKLVLSGQCIQVYVDDVLLGTLAPSTEDYLLPSVKNIMGGIAVRNLANNYAIKSAKAYPNNPFKYMHISFDDCINILKDINDKVVLGTPYASIFDNPQLEFLKSMHDTYGAVFSLYCFFENSTGWLLSSMTANYSEEFRQNSDWLKFGFHGEKPGVYYDNTTTTVKAQTDFNNIINAIRTFAHGHCIDSVIRTSYYSGNLDNCRIFRDSEMSIQGFLTSDDSRVADLYLDALQRDAVEKCDDYLDTTEKLYFVRTDLRLESYADPIAQLNSRLVDKNYAGQMDVLTIFTHEPRLINGEQLENIEDVIKWAVANEYIFDFPMNNIPKC